MAVIKACAVEGCVPATRLKLGLCAKHYQRWRKYGSTDDPRVPAVERFWSLVDKTDDCWLWRGKLSDHGYGLFSMRGRWVRAHRLAYEWAGGQPPPLNLDHRYTCPKNCIRPDHLRPATQKYQGENLAGAHSHNRSSGVRGVSWHKQQQKWMAHATHHGKFHSGGLFDTIAEAEVAAIALRNRLFTHNDADRRVS